MKSSWFSFYFRAAFLFTLAAPLLVGSAHAQQTLAYANGDNNGSTIVVTGTLNPTTLTIALGSATQSGAISDSGTLGTIIKDGNGTLSLTGTNTYSGTTNLNGGILNLGSSGALGTSALTFGGGTLQYSAANTTDYSSGIVNSTSGAIAIDPNGKSITFASALDASNTSGLKLLGTGTLNLKGANTYTGNTTVQVGTLLLGGFSSTGSIDPSSTLIIGSKGIFTYARLGNTTQAFNGLSVTSGIGTINNTSSGSTLALGAITRSGRGMIDFATMTGTISTSTTNTNGIIGAWAFTGAGSNLKYAVANGSGATITSMTGTTATVNTLDNVLSSSANYSYSGAATTPYNLTGNTLQYLGTTGTTTLGAHNLTLNGLMNSGTGHLTISSTLGQGGLVIGNSGELDIVTNNAGITLAASISGTGTVVYGGIGTSAATITLTAPNLSHGDVIINSGTVITTSGGALGALGNLTLSTGAILDLHDNFQRIGALVGTGGVITNNGVSATIFQVGFSNATGGVYNGVIQDASGSIVLQKSGTGTQTLSGANTYSGGTLLGLGTLVAGTSTILATASGTTTITSGPFGKGRLSIATGSTLDDNGSNITLANSLSLSGTITFGSTGAGSLTFDGTALTTTATVTLAGTTTLIVNNTTTIADTINYGGFTLTKSGAGTLILTGGTAVTSGTLSVSNPGNLGPGTITLANGTGLQYTGSTDGIFAQGITVTGTTGSSATVFNTSGNVMTLSGTLTKNGTTLNISGGRNVITGPITGSSSNSDVNYIDGTATGLMAASSYNGPTSISGASTVLTGIDNALPNPAPSTDLTLGATGETSSTVNTLDLLGHSQTVASLTAVANGTNQVISSNGSATTPSIGSGASTGTGNLTVDYNGGSTDTYTGLLGDADGARAANNFSLTKTGTGTLALAGTNTYTGGTHVINGTLLADNAGGSATGSGPLTVDSGAVLGGTGTIASSINTISGTVQAGAGGTDTNGILTLTATGSTTFSNANLIFDLSTTSLGQSTQLNLGDTSSVLFSNTTLTLHLEGLSTIPNTTEYALLTSSIAGLGAGGSIFSGITVDGSGRISGLNLALDSNYQNSYLKLVFNGSGYNINIDVEVAPEPGTWALLLGSFCLLALGRRIRIRTT